MPRKIKGGDETLKYIESFLEKLGNSSFLSIFRNTNYDINERLALIKEILNIIVELNWFRNEIGKDEYKTVIQMIDDKNFRDTYNHKYRGNIKLTSIIYCLNKYFISISPDILYKRLDEFDDIIPEIINPIKKGHFGINFHTDKFEDDFDEKIFKEYALKRGGIFKPKIKKVIRKY